MQINELTDVDCEACGLAVDLASDRVEPILPLLCEDCLSQLVEDEADPALPVAA